MKTKLLIAFLLLSYSLCFSQKKISWEDLSHVKFTEKYYPEYSGNFLYPEFSDSVKALEGKEISIIGYFLNIDPRKNMYVLSKGPMSACFFCGIGGPETAMELQFTSKQNFKTDTIVIVTGILKLNADDVEHFNYILTNSKASTLN